MRRAYVRCAISAVLFGAATPAASKLGDRLSPFVLAGVLYLGAALAMTPLAMPSFRRNGVADRGDGRTDPESGPGRRGGLGRLAIAVVFGGMVGPVLLMLALDRSPASSVSLLLNLEVVFTVLLAAIVFHEHLGGWLVLGMAAVAGAGVVLVWSPGFDLRLGALLTAGACAAWAIDNTTTANLDSFTPYEITLAKGVVAGSVNLAIGLGLHGSFEFRAALVALLVGALGYGVSIALWIGGAREVGAARGQVIFAIAPFVGAVLSWWVLREPVESRALLAVALAAIGVALVVRSEHDHAHAHEEMIHDHEHVHEDGHHTHVHADGFTGRHSHPHEHGVLEHAHSHVPDLHHRHAH